jgi:hypothetical protein
MSLFNVRAIGSHTNVAGYPSFLTVSVTRAFTRHLPHYCTVSCQDAARSLARSLACMLDSVKMSRNNIFKYCIAFELVFLLNFVLYVYLLNFRVLLMLQSTSC